LTYSQSTGRLTTESLSPISPGQLIGVGYSGAGEGKNDPSFDDVVDVGPLPAGHYKIGAPEDMEGGPHGPFVLPLTPDPANEMFGRSGFLIHGDTDPPGNASEGCIILPREVREAIAASPDKHLEVVP